MQNDQKIKDVEEENGLIYDALKGRYEDIISDLKAKHK
jgi:hypothetical protein